jgi:type VI secretion system protein ImpK
VGGGGGRDRPAAAGLYDLLWLLNSASDPVFTAMGGIRDETVAMVRRSGVTAAPAPVKPQAQENRLRISQDLRKFLDPQIRQGLIDVIDDADKTTIRIRGDGLFDSGSANIKPAFMPLLAQIGQELNTVQGKVLVTGHSDNRPINTLQFPSNWHLSKARADSVVKLLAAVSNNPSRFIGEGRADTEPVATNNTPQGRAQNRRVDIILLARVN